VLEKLNILHDTIASLKDLAFAARKLNEDFNVEAKELINDVEGQIEGFGNFEEQENQIGDLEKRIRAGRERIKLLGNRLQTVQGKVKGWEKREGEWQEKTRKRLKILWVMMGGCVLAFLVLLVLQYGPIRGLGESVMGGLNISNTSLDGPVAEAVGSKLENKTVELQHAANDVLDDALGKNAKQELPEDPRLRLFDEL
jgi:hypothetical protein